MADEDQLGGSNFLATAADNRISVVADPDRWEGLEDDDSDFDEDSLAAGTAAETPHPQKQSLQPIKQQQQQSIRGSGEAENESYRMFLTQREQQQQQQQPAVRQDPPDDPENENDEERFVEQLGSKLVLQPSAGSQQRWASYDEGATEEEGPTVSVGLDNPRRGPSQSDRGQLPAAAAEEPVPAAPAPTSDTGRNFSVRKGGKQLANLLPRKQQQPPPQQQQQQQQHQQPQAQQNRQPAMRKSASMPLVPKEVYAGYLRLDSGHILGPFRWIVDEVEAPATLEDGLSSSRAQQSDTDSLFLLLADSGLDGSDGRDLGRQRFLTRRGRLDFVDPNTGAEVTATGDRAPPLQPILLTANRRLEQLAVAAGVAEAAGVDAELTRNLATALTASGASLLIASVSPIEGRPSQDRRSRPSVQASVVARNPDLEQIKELEKLVQSLRTEVDSLKSENSGLRDRLKAESSKPPLPPSASTTASKSHQQQLQEQRPMSKSSYQSLYEMLQEYMQENETLRTENLGLVKSQGDRLRDQDLLAKENRRLAERLNRMQRQQAAQQKPLYVVSNPDSRASSNQQGRALQQQQQQQATPTAASAVTSTTDTLLPPIPTMPEIQQQQQQQQRAARPAFPTPPAGQKFRQSPQSLPRQQQQQMPYYYAPSSDSQQNAPYSYYATGHIPVGPQYLQQLQPPPPPPPHPAAAAPVHLLTESPLYVPKPGEVTYRGRFRQAANNGGRSDARRRGGAAGTHAVKDVNRLNESLKSELRELDGAIQQHQRVNALQSDIRRNEGRKVLKTF